MRSSSPTPSCFSFFRPSRRQSGAISLPAEPSISSKEKEFMDIHFNSHSEVLPPYLSEPTRTVNDKVLQTIDSSLTSYSAALRKISLFISDHPELSNQESLAHKKLTDFLIKEGFEVTKSYILPTAFKASFTLPGKDKNVKGRHVGFCSEYDALPGVGNACGHNLIAIGGVAALLSLRDAMTRHQTPGTITLVGTPAEEAGGGKDVLIKKGAFDEFDACLMIHPTPGITEGQNGLGAIQGTLAVQQFGVEFFGHTAHAAAAPWEGINALDAATQAYLAVSTLRQQIHPTNRVHGIITAGGLAPNVIPDYTAMRWCVRSVTAKEVGVLMEKVEKCFRAAALATGCTYKLTLDGPPYNELRNNLPLAETFSSVLADLYNTPVKLDIDRFEGASTDFGNVTYHVPACHPCFAIPTGPGEGNHTIGFTKAARTQRAHEEAIKFSAGLAGCGYKVLADESFANEARTWWKKDMESL